MGKVQEISRFNYGLRLSEPSESTLRPCFNRDQFELQEGGYGRIVGRLKDIIIRDNSNIYPTEVEQFFMTHPNIMEVQVT